jgi:hypothetical protein
MFQLTTSIEIEATPITVWNILLDFSQYPIWNPFIKRVIGDAAPGNRLEITIQPPGSSAMTFRPKILVSACPTELRWIGRLLLPGIFDGEHILNIEPISKERVRFHQTENFSGLLIPFAKSSLQGATKKGFESMNLALKARAESTAKNPA